MINANEAAASFAPHSTLAEVLLTAIDPPETDGSHNVSHIQRVWLNAAAIMRAECPCDSELVAAAVLLHDCVAIEKDSPRRSLASRLAAGRAREIVGSLGWPSTRIAALAHAIEAHSFSAGIEPETLEARIVQDADRLDAIGAIGIARCFYVGGRMGSALYHPVDPGAERRTLDDRHFALDHFGAKLFIVASGFRTTAGQAIAAKRTRVMRDFVAAFHDEIGMNSASERSEAVV